ncbi:MAG: SDR family NAD(P)-dependent oxidoreductase [Kiritimatiellaeota bacterium]|nr:SDR family NAD(P)-dependent oxidoreductase [Kiritimatiellota bacterium]
MRELEAHAALSRRFGSDPRFVVLGGGNTSIKTAELLYIKPSGVALGSIGPDQFIAVERTAIRDIFSADLPADVWEREAAVKDLMLRAVRPAGAGRPSVETPLHEALSFRYVYHMHPALVNGMTCARNGAEVCRRLFPDALWVSYTDPGYTLAKTVAHEIEALRAAGRPEPSLIFLQNHGVFAGADTLEGVQALYERVISVLEDAYSRAGVATALETSGHVDTDVVLEWAPALRSLLGTPEQRATVCAAAEVFAPAEGPLTPDHIVYGKSYPFVADRFDPDGVAAFVASRGYLPRVIAVPGRAVFGADMDLKRARGVRLVARDGALVRQLTEAFGGPRFLADRERGFIENWEVESYRRKVTAGDGRAGRVHQKVCVITGGAQGFGLGIARGLLAEGAVAAIADINIEGARKAIAALETEFGADRVFAVQVNVSDEESVRAMVATVTRECGGIDLFVSNAGVLRAAPVRELSKEDWDFVTAVNYTGYFLCVKHASRVMAAQAAVGAGPWTDIIQINSKSGLEGSNKNAAYAGSKFGGVGLTQSFAKELVADRIKVNGICPGNYFDGPLWSDPDNGLFVQYLRAGKVPGARSIEDVRRFYEAKVPMNRGCTPQDVVRAILYLIEQDYETGQALPVTGGQVMLR